MVPSPICLAILTRSCSLRSRKPAWGGASLMQRLLPARRAGGGEEERELSP